ncbi:MAG: hypothetical protein GXP62_12645 [Oligoflexia bacterium]|nr:hypothetical protein [Oligoflexia bacterium]
MRPKLGSAATQALLDQSDTVVAGLQAQGVEDVGSEISDRLAEIQLTDADRRAFFDANRHLFGQRDYDQSRWTVDQLLRIQRTRAELGITRLSPYFGAAPTLQDH